MCMIFNRNVKLWRPGDQIERCVGSGLLVAGRQFRKVVGHRRIPLLMSSLADAVSKNFHITEAEKTETIANPTWVNLGTASLPSE